MAVAAVVTSNVTITLTGNQSQSTGTIGSTSGGASLSVNPKISVVDSLINSNTTGVVKAVDQLYQNQVNFVASTPQTFHFGNASLKDPFGNTITMARIRLLAIQVIDTTAGHDLQAYASASNGITWLPAAAAPNLIRANFGLVILAYDPNSTGGGNGNVISNTTDGITLNPGSNAIAGVNILCIGESVA